MLCVVLMRCMYVHPCIIMCTVFYVSMFSCTLSVIYVGCGQKQNAERVMFL